MLLRYRVVSTTTLGWVWDGVSSPCLFGAIIYVVLS
jgi:hypothetical protein